jgi:hypothetical protein
MHCKLTSLFGLTAMLGMFCMLLSLAHAAPQSLGVDVAADREAGMVYVPGVRALRIADGAEVWAVSALAPIGGAGALLLVLGQSEPARRERQQMVILGLDPLTGAERVRCERTVPGWVVQGMGRSHGHAFAITTESASDEAVVVHWSASTWWGDGENPGPAILAAARNSDQGAFRCDLTTGRTRPIRDTSNPAPAGNHPVTLGDVTLTITAGPRLTESAGVVVPDPERRAMRRVLQASRDEAVLWDRYLPSLQPSGYPPD